MSKERHLRVHPWFYRSQLDSEIQTRMIVSTTKSPIKKMHAVSTNPDSIFS